MRIVNTTCEGWHNPVHIDIDCPGLSWQLDSGTPGACQTAYRIQAASAPELLDRTLPDLWDTGIVHDDRSQWIVYQGVPLQFAMDVYWRVRVWDQEGAPSSWSEVAYWKMAMLQPSDWQGHWIAAEDGAVRLRSRMEISPESARQTATLLEEAPAPYFRKEIDIRREIRRATAYICGLGYYELYLNGAKAGDLVLNPVFSDFSQSVYAMAHNVTELLIAGTNTIGIVLGNGFYNMPTRDLFQMEHAHWKTPPKLLFNLLIEYADGNSDTIASDAQWRISTGSIRFNCIRGGETIDLRLEPQGWNLPGFDDSEWTTALEVLPPTGQLRFQSAPGIRVVRLVDPVRSVRLDEATRLYDFGGNYTGWTKLALQAPEGTKLMLKSGERLNEAGRIDGAYSSEHTYGRYQTEVFIADGRGRMAFEPRFTYHGFRFVQIEGLTPDTELSSVQACVAHTDLESAGTFECSDDRLNRLHRAVRKTLLNSVHGMPGTEPTREKMGWTQDAQNTMTAYLYNFQARQIFAKYVQDMVDGQEDNGHVPPIVPTNGWGLVQADGQPIYFDDPWWGGTLPIVVRNLYEFYGDKRVIAAYYGAMKRYVDFVGTTADHGIVSWSLGDWLDFTWQDSDTRMTSVKLTSTAAYYHLNRLVAGFADLLGKAEDAQHYGEVAESVKQAFNHTFLNSESGVYERGSQTAQALPLWLGLAPEEARPQVLNRLLDEISRYDGHATTGFVGVMPMLHVLSDMGHIDIAYRMVTQEKSPGWLHMLDNGNDTLGENLNAKGYGTYHHPFAACVGAWLYRDLAGIVPLVDETGAVQFKISPKFPAGLAWVKAEYQCLRGPVKVAWQKQQEFYTVEVGLPANVSAVFHYPDGTQQRLEAGTHTNLEVRGNRQENQVY